MTKYVIIDENPEEAVKMCESNNEEELIEHFGLSHCTILRINNEKVEWAHWIYKGVEWKIPEETKEILSENKATSMKVRIIN